MKKELLTIVASLALATSLSASVNSSTRISTAAISIDRSHLSLMAREVQPGDQRHGRGKDDKKGHKFAQEVAREVQPGDQRHGRGKDDKKGHKLV